MGSETVSGVALDNFLKCCFFGNHDTRWDDIPPDFTLFLCILFLMPYSSRLECERQFVNHQIIIGHGIAV